MTNKGIILVETMVVVSIIAILVIAFGFSYQGWMGKYKIESQIKELYSDLMEARTRAMTRNMLHFAVINEDNYDIYEDTNNSYGNSPDAEDHSIWPKPKTLISGYPFKIKMISLGTLPRTLTFDTRGLISNATAAISLRIDNSLDPDFDCLIIDEARIRMGKTNTTETACNEK